MATLEFEGETHAEIVAKVRRWLASVDGQEVAADPVEVIERSAELAKDALRVLASSAPGPVADSDVMKALTAMGYQATDTAKQAVVDALDALSQVSGGSVVERVSRGGQSALFQMNTAIAKQVLKTMRPK